MHVSVQWMWSVNAWMYVYWLPLAWIDTIACQKNILDNAWYRLGFEYANSCIFGYLSLACPVAISERFVTHCIYIYIYNLVEAHGYSLNVSSGDQAFHVAEYVYVLPEYKTGDSVAPGKDLRGRNVQLPPILCYMKCSIIITDMYTHIYKVRPGFYKRIYIIVVQSTLCSWMMLVGLKDDCHASMDYSVTTQSMNQSHISTAASIYRCDWCTATKGDNKTVGQDRRTYVTGLGWCRC